SALQEKRTIVTTTSYSPTSLLQSFVLLFVLTERTPHCSSAIKPFSSTLQETPVWPQEEAAIYLPRSSPDCLRRGICRKMPQEWPYINTEKPVTGPPRIIHNPH